jgi:hypothetical protein
MAYPSLEQYRQAFQLHSRLLADPELQSCVVAKNNFGMPLAISGGFALTYTLSSSAKKYAVRCFHREAKGLEKRYDAISKKLATLSSPYFLEFSFQPSGIKVEGQAYPVVKMAWAKGETLGEFLEKNYQNPQALLQLTKALMGLASFLEKEGIAHGDLQTGNLMVSDNGMSLQLIDYDGMFVEDIRGLGSSELGHVNFQHVGRKSLNPFDASLDRFSLISLVLAIKALRVDSSLWRKTDSELDAIVFRSNDFLDPGSSKAFSLLATNSQLEAETKKFATICSGPYSNVPTLTDFISGKFATGTEIKFTGVAAPGKAKLGYVGAYPVLSAVDFNACLLRVGDKVEVIGRITAVKESFGKNGQRYIFVNFSDWRGHVFKVSIWNNGIDALPERPTRTWIGRWLSIVGLMEPPYSNDGWRSSNVSISISTPGQMSALSEPEANWRLGLAKEVSLPAQDANLSGNLDALSRIKGTLGTSGVSKSIPTAATTPRSPSAVPPPTQSPPLANPITSTGSKSTTAYRSSSNQDILNKIRAGTTASSTPSGPGGSAPNAQGVPRWTPPNSTSTPQRPQAPRPQRAAPVRRSLLSKIIGWIVD